jgi:UDP-N-acetylglucosamine transferase subunit ALG13
MIFVTVGNDFRSFDRLLKKMDEIAPSLPHDLVIQRGYSRYRPLNGTCFDFVPMEKAIDYMKESRMVVSHSGIGTIILCREHGIPLLVLPRRKRYEEHMNDHQLEVAAALEERQDGNIHVVYDENRLKERILEILRGPARCAPTVNMGKSNLIRIIREFVERI